MPDVVPEQSVVKVPEAVTPKPAEATKPVDKPLGAPEQAIIQTIKQESDPDDALRDIAETKPTATAPTPDKPKLGTPMIDAYLRSVDRIAKQLLAGEITPDKLQSYIFTIREQGVPGDRVEETLLIRGINVDRKTPSADSNGAQPSTELTQDGNSDVEILRRAFNIEPLNVTTIRENPIIEKQTIDRSAVTLASQGDKVIVRYGGRDWYTIDGRMKTGIINGQSKNFVFMNSGGGDAEYNPVPDTYNIGVKGLERFRSDPDLFTSGLLHEAGHDRYMSLTQAQQRSLNDIFLQNPMLRDSLFKFGAAFYGDGKGVVVEDGKTVAGQRYLDAHTVKEGKVNANITNNDGEKGIKDTRTLVFNWDGQTREVYASSLITEYISYMSQLEMSREVFDKFTSVGKTTRGGKDLRMDALFLGFKRLQADPQLRQAFESFGIFKDNTPQLASDFAKVASTI
jgi:hypothetical protein